LRDYQIEIVDKYINYVSNPICSGSSNNGSGGILEVPCGRGKTIMALKIISELKKKTLIIVHKEFLMNQWIERIEEFLPGARIGKIQAQVFENCSLPIRCTSSIIVNPKHENVSDGYSISYNVCIIPMTISLSFISKT
jgi:superfamily II DNA or RNA helicase